MLLYAHLFPLKKGYLQQKKHFMAPYTIKCKKWVFFIRKPPRIYCQGKRTDRKDFNTMNFD